MHTLHDLIKFQPLFCDLYLPTSFVFFQTFSAVFLVNEQQRLVPITIYFWSLFCAIYSVFIWYEEREVASMKAHLDGIFFLKKKTSVWVFVVHGLTFFNVFNCHRSYSQSIHYSKLTQNENFSREICNLRNSHEFIKICLFSPERYQNRSQRDNPELIIKCSPNF